MEWTSDVTMEFLDLLEEEPIIWNPKHPNYKEINLKFDAWKRIQENFSLDCSLKVLKSKKENLLHSYRRLESKVSTTKTAGRATNEVYKPDWFAFEKISSFMHGVYIPKPSRNSETTEGNGHENLIANETVNCESTTPNETPVGAGSCQLQPGGPPSTKKRKTNIKEATEKRMEATFKILQKVAEKPKKDKSLAFCELLCIQLREMDNDSQDIAMHEINNLIFHLTRGRRSAFESYDAQQFSVTTGYFEDQQETSPKIYQ